MERLHCDIRPAGDDDRSMLALLAHETLQPLAESAGHPERYCTADVLDLLERGEVYVAETRDEPAGFVAVEREGDALAVRCVIVSPACEARGVANQLVDWVEGLAIDRRLVRLTAHVPTGDNPSLRLYRGHGFAVRPATEAGMLELEKHLVGEPG